MIVVLVCNRIIHDIYSFWYFSTKLSAPSLYPWQNINWAHPTEPKPIEWYPMVQYNPTELGFEPQTSLEKVVEGASQKEQEGDKNLEVMAQNNLELSCTVYSPSTIALRF